VIPSEPPVCNSLLLAEHVYRDGLTGKWVIAGVFNRIALRDFPGRMGPFVVFFQITNLARQVDLRLRIERAATQESIFEYGGPIRINDPLAVFEHALNINGAVFPEPGKYWIQLRSGEEILTQVPIDIALAQRPSRPES
jgi:hypothetical protein